MKRLHQVHLLQQTICAQLVASNLSEVAEHKFEQGQCLNLTERQGLLAAQDRGVPLWMLFRRVEGTREALGQGDASLLFCHENTSFMVSSDRILGRDWRPLHSHGAAGR